MTEGSFLRAMSEVTGSALDPQTRAQILALEAVASRVSVFEVTDLESRPVVILAHDSERPSNAALRRAYESAHRAAGRQR